LFYIPLPADTETAPDITMTDVEMPASSDLNKENVKSSQGGYQIPFVEKYRPKTLDDVVGNEETLLRLRAIAKDGNMPNLILCGPPGTGKTTSVHALARQLLGSSYKDAVLELNASDARGIDVSRKGIKKVLSSSSNSLFLQVVRNRIKSFAMNKVTLPPGRYVKG
jgi:replication factor C subunit 2/4